MNASSDNPTARAPGTPIPRAPEPPLVIPADQIEVIPKDAASPAEPVGPPPIRTVEVAPKKVLPNTSAQLHHQLVSGVRVRGVVVSEGVRLVRVMAGVVEHTVVPGQDWSEAFPAGLELETVPGGVFLTAVVRNDGAEPVTASAAFALEDLPKSAQGNGSSRISPSGQGVPRTRGPRGPQSPPAGVTRRANGPPPGAQGGGMRRTVNPAVGGVRQGPARNAVAPTRNGVRTGFRAPEAAPVGSATEGSTPPRTTPRIGQPQNGPSPHRQANASSPSSLSPTIPPNGGRRKPVADPSVAGPAPVPGEGEILVRVEAWRLPALRDLARKGCPVPPTHVGAFQNAIRKRGDSPGLPFVLPEALANRLLKVLQRGGKMSSEERDELASCLDGTRMQSAPKAVETAPEGAPPAAETQPAPLEDAKDEAPEGAAT